MTFNQLSKPGISAFPGKIQSGTGKTYQVQLYENGKNKPTTRTVTAEQMQIDSSETIPKDTYVFVFQAGTEYLIQVPVWLE